MRSSSSGWSRSDAADPGDGKGVPLDEIAQTPQTRIAAEWSYLPDRGTVHLLVLRPFDGKLSWRVFVDGSDVHACRRQVIALFLVMADFLRRRAVG